jgi:uncharacterized membrane protein
VFVLPSDREGMPLALFEAMAAGLPVIGSDVQGIREHSKGCGVLVKPPSPEGFASAIDDLNRHRDERYGVLSEAARSKAARYSWPKLTARLEKIYHELTPRAQPWRLGRLGLLVGVTVWWLVFLLLRDLPQMPEPVVNAVGFSFLALVPGMLTVRCLRLQTTAWGKLALAVGLSILELMSVALLGNTVLQWFHVGRPLDTRVLIPELSGLLLLLGVQAWRRTGDWTISLPATWRTLFPTALGRLVAFMPLVFVLLSVLGATSLNNGGTSGFTMLMLAGIAAFSLWLVAKGGKLNNTSVATAIFLLSLAVLLMNSLRGWYTTGHDIQQEYWVFQFTKAHGVWRIQDYRNPYNACLSITILPTIFANLLKTLGPYVFKIYFQILFAVCPPVIYLFFRRWTSVAVAFLGAFYFIAFPTFFTDMSFLNRQEIAFVFAALMFYTLYMDRVKLRLRMWLFLWLGVGLILSHYSTTYSMLVVLYLALAVWPLLTRLGHAVWRHPFFTHSALKAVQTTRAEAKRITFTMVFLLTVGSVLWTAVLTDTGTSTALIARQTIAAIGDSFQADAPKSNNTQYSLFAASSLTPAQEFQQYLNTAVKRTRSANPNLYYPVATYQRLPVKVTTDATQPLTALGQKLSHWGLNVVSFDYDFRQDTAKLLQVLVLSGFIFIMFRRTYGRLFDSDYVALAIGSVVFVVLQVVLPILSVQYGLLRAFQQSLMLLGLLTVLGSLAWLAWIPKRSWRIGGAALIAAVFFLSSTGVFTQVLGGYYAQLNLDNAGVYYDSYYTHAQEIAGITWLNGVAGRTINGTFEQRPVQMDEYTASKLSTYSRLVPINGIYPSLIQKNAYVFLGYSNITRDEATAAYNSDLLTYTFNTQQFLNQQKNLLYSNGGTAIYQ